MKIYYTLNEKGRIASYSTIEDEKMLSGDITEEQFAFLNSYTGRCKVVEKDNNQIEFIKEEYSQEELADIEKMNTYHQKIAQINVLKNNLKETDYKAIKYAEGLISETDYEEIRKERESWRAEINALEEDLEGGKNDLGNN